MKTNNRAIIMHPMAAVLVFVWMFFTLCSTCCICFMQHNIVNAMDLWNVWYKNDDNQRFSYINERHFGFMLIMS